MENLNYLLYILATSIGPIKPYLVDRLVCWHAQTESNKLKPDFSKLPENLALTKNQTERFFETLKVCSESKFNKLLSETKITAINLFDEQYPYLLKQIPDSPLVLYCRGNINLFNNQHNLAIVGSRRATKYGELVVNKIVGDLANNPVCIISGLAYGIDAQAHQTALKNKLQTIAVLGSAIDDLNIFPKENYQLAQSIIQNGGLIISEYPPGTVPQKHYFIARNRIIAGLSQATLIIEAAQKSGALITSDFATEYNRQVYAIPGSILSPQSVGTNKLIGQGASPLLSATTFLEEFGLSSKQPQTNSNFNSEELAVLQYMQNEEQTFEQLLTLTKLQTTTLQATLSTLELKSKIQQVHPQIYQAVS